MEFGSLLVDALRTHNPRAFNQIARAGQLKAWMLARSKEANSRLAEILAQTPDWKNSDGSENPNARRCAEEIVLAEMTYSSVTLHD